MLGRSVGLGLAVAAALAGPVRAASLLPATMEEATTLPSGTAEVTLGASYFDELRFPPFTVADGMHTSQTLLAVPQLGFRIGAGNWAEVQASFELLHLRERRPSDGRVDEGGPGDMRMFTKVTVFRERTWLPAVGLRFGTKLPNANRAARLGTDETDFAADGLLTKNLPHFAVHANLGLLLLGNPDGHGQDDLFEYTAGVASYALDTAATGIHLRFFGEIAGVTGSHNDNNRSSLRGGVQILGAPLTVYLGASAGLVRESENVGFYGGLIWTFRPESFGGN